MSPPWNLARVDPVSRHSRTHRITLAAATPKRSAAARRERPPSTAAITRVRRSSEMDFVMPGWPPRPADILNQISQRKGILPDSVRSDYALSWRYHHGAHRNGNKCGKTKGYQIGRAHVCNQ